MSLRFLLLALVPVSLAVAADQPAAAGKPSHHRVRLGGIMINAGYTHFSGYPYYGYYPGYWGYAPYYYFDPFLWSSLYYPGYWSRYAWQPGLGNVKLQVAEKTAMVYLDGALAGRADELKNMWLDPGVYNLEVREGQRRLAQKIYVLSGKTLKITPGMMNQEALP